MKRHLPLLALLLALAGVAATLRGPRNPAAFEVVAFSRLPTLVNGRIKPLDTVARTALLTMQGRQRVQTPDGRTLAPAEWLLDVFFRPELAHRYATFEIVHPDVLALMNLATEDGAGGKRFSGAQLARGLSELDRQAKLADDTEPANRTPFQRAVVQLRDNVVLYQRLQSSALPLGADAAAFSLNLRQFFDFAEQGGPSAPRAAASDAEASRPRAERTAHQSELAAEFRTMEQFACLRLVPPGEKDEITDWKTLGAAWSRALAARRPDAVAAIIAELGRTWQLQDAPAFNAALARYTGQLAASESVAKCNVETRFNAAQPFYSSALLYVVAFLLAVLSWLKWPAELARAAFYVLFVAFLVSTVGIAVRMWLEARPPVTNLYSSALFVGWGAVALCLILERVYRNGVGSVAGGLVGFATLVIAHHLSLGGDTLEMMRAVLDSNFWLATHVVTIAVGYSATFLAGLLAAIYILRGVLTRSLDDSTAAALGRMIYGIVCFATLFSFVGTILGGIWADQSWGRFWGWDPKENGALLIVIWNSVILHVRWGGMVKTRGLACLALFGNIVTAWSWFGVNMLGVGLHSYGFMDSAMWWLVAFALSQLAIIAVAAVPLAKWRSFRAA